MTDNNEPYSKHSLQKVGEKEMGHETNLRNPRLECDTKLPHHTQLLSP
ncbi:hypothetical protein DB29_02209 [Shouchella clausii]|nr:hypothetical protein DB29_02209 [Shouchella clausii]